MKTRKKTMKNHNKLFTLLIVLVSCAILPYEVLAQKNEKPNTANYRNRRVAPICH